LGTHGLFELNGGAMKVKSVTMLAEGLGWPEGPTMLPDGRIAFVESYRSQISVFDERTGKVSQLHDVGGGPNACLCGSDGSLYVTQNGGVIGPWRADVQRPPSIQRISPEGQVEILLDAVEGHRLMAPNDLAFGPDGWLYFTDPAGPYDPVTKSNPGFVCAVKPDGTGVLLEELEATYPNGIVVEDDGSVVWVESYTRAIRRRTAAGVEDVFVFDAPVVPDGFKIDQTGNFYVTGVNSGSVEIVDRSGTYLSSLKIGAIPTNCLFVGSTLYVTDGGKPGTSLDVNLGGALWKVELEDVTGQQVFLGSIS
jgi:gluconolactonase